MRTEAGMAGLRCQSGGLSPAGMRGAGARTRVMFMLGAALGPLGADTGAWDASALRVRAAAIAMVAAVPAGLAWVNPTAATYCWALIPIVQWAAGHCPAPTWR